MNVILNQTIYQCEYCGKRLLSKNGAKIHEEQYCYKSPIVKEKRKQEILLCKHKWETSWTPIAGEEWRHEPDYEYCIYCNVKDNELNQIEQEI